MTVMFSQASPRCCVLLFVYQSLLDARPGPGPGRSFHRDLSLSTGIPKRRFNPNTGDDGRTGLIFIVSNVKSCKSFRWLNKFTLIPRSHNHLKHFNNEYKSSCRQGYNIYFYNIYFKMNTFFKPCRAQVSPEEPNIWRMEGERHINSSRFQTLPQIVCNFC